MAQVHEKGVLHMCHTCPSRLLPSHFSVSLLFLDGHFETTPDYDFTDDFVHMFLPYLPVQTATWATPHMHREVWLLGRLRCKHRMESPSSWKVVKLVFLRKPDAAPTKGSEVTEQQR